MRYSRQKLPTFTRFPARHRTGAQIVAAAAAVVAAGLALPADAGGHAQVSGFALAEGGSTLLVMSDIGAPGAVMSFDLASPVSGLAWRPVTGTLLGIADGMVAEIDPMSGEMTDLGATFAEDARIAEGAVTAFDFNNQIDAVRAVTSEGANLVYFPVGFGDMDDRANSVLRFTDPFYAEGDVNEGAEPMIFANAYTNAIAGETAGSTFQYALDAATDSLVSLANNAGTLQTVGPVTVDGAAVDLAAMGGFDIVSPAEGENMAYAILQMAGADTAGLYAIDLETGAATLSADLGMGGVSGFAATMTP